MSLKLESFARARHLELVSRHKTVLVYLDEARAVSNTTYRGEPRSLARLSDHRMPK